MEDQGRKSAVWKYFKLDGKKAECQLCKANLSFCGGTTNLRNHMSNRHSGISLTSNKQHQNKKKTGHRCQKSAFVQRAHIEQSSNNMVYSNTLPMVHCDRKFKKRM
ncbi:uncharacterized protein LOC143250476 [Tachypleus tridentatus]|uniref:uncharacterized protein LOC143250476 n=1 Tax=Tachypleus tridentatus TaxID=6853 RepID=UPI003FD0EADE